MVKKLSELNVDAQTMEQILEAFKMLQGDVAAPAGTAKRAAKTAKRKRKLKTTEYLQLKISLDGIKPLIWRRVIVDPTLSLEEMNEVIWCVMPWMGHHMHSFSNKTIRVTVPYDDPFNELSNTDDYEDLVIGNFFSAEGDKCKYEYDFGDSWEHTILLEKFVTPLESARAKFITGKNLTPPDDCGGRWGYERLKEVMQNPKDPEHKEMREWLGMEDDEIFDPKDLGFTAEDIADINEEFEGL